MGIISKGLELNNLKTKNVDDLNVKHFSRYGEFLVSFELSKHGWNVYSPIYDEYIDLLIHKHVCSKCGKNWDLTPALICKKCSKDFSKTQKSNIIAKKKCRNCGAEMFKNKTKCIKCGGTDLLNIPTCDVNNCGGEVELKNYLCKCGNATYISKIRSIQVKSSRIERKNGKSKNTYAVDMKPRDLIKDSNHFYIWCLIDEKDTPHFLVMSVNNFIDTMGNSLNGISFLKDQDRQHFNSKDYGKWGIFLDKFDILE